ncbi:NAD-dependent epimerase/dehydratase family protein [Micavibrio aeruginosavorus]|uniref:NAD-dependent epimerase/dehydratase family protein n=1 Tax=Micavibrio aeruginosavorus TaxID=349221 RepID=UPI003F4AC84B
MKVLVTGANGLLGRRLAQRLSDRNSVHAVVRAMPENPLSNVEYHKIDLGGEWSDASLPRDIDVIFHLAQSENFRNFPDKAMDIFRVNVDSTARLLDFAKRVSAKHFVYASSGGVYGTGNQAFHENSPITSHGKLGYYLGSKLCSEILVENYAQCMIVNIVRFFFIYGPEQKRSMLIPRLVDSVRDGRAIQLQGERGISINPIHVSDAVVALEKIMDIKESATFNMAGAESFSLRDIAMMAGAVIGKDPVFEKVGDEGQNIIANIDLMKKILVEPSISLRDGLKQLV